MYSFGDLLFNIIMCSYYYIFKLLNIFYISPKKYIIYGK